MRSFSAKIQIFFKVGRIKKYDEGRVFFQKKNIIIFQKFSSQKREGGKYADGSRPCS